MHDFHYFCVFLVYKIKVYARIAHAGGGGGGGQLSNQ